MRNTLNICWKAILYSLGLSCVWAGCLVWHRQHAPVYEARATISVPDLEDAQRILQAPEFRQFANRRLTGNETGINVEGEFEPETPLNGEILVTHGSEPGQVEVAYRVAERGYAVTHLQVLLEAFLQQSQMLPGDETGSTPIPALQKQSGELAAQLESLRTKQQKLQAQSEATRTGVLPTSEGDRTPVLEAALAEAKLARLDAEHDLLQADRAIAERMPIEHMKAIFTDEGPQQIVQDVVDQVRFTEELLADQATLRQLSKVYGAKHPQRISLENKIADKLALLETVPAEVRLVSAETTPQSLLLSALEQKLAEQRLVEQELENQLGFERSLRRKQTEETQEQITVAREIKAAVEQLADVQLQLEQVQDEPEDAKVSVARNPWLAPDPVSPSLLTLLSGSTPPGLLLGWIFCGLMSAILKPSSRDSSRAQARYLAAHRSSLHERREERMLRLQQARAGKA